MTRRVEVSDDVLASIAYLTTTSIMLALHHLLLSPGKLQSSKFAPSVKIVHLSSSVGLLEAQNYESFFFIEKSELLFTK